MAKTEWQQFGEACRFLATDQQRKFMSQGMRAHFTAIRERYINGPVIQLECAWTPGIIGEIPERYEDYTRLDK